MRVITDHPCSRTPNWIALRADRAESRVPAHLLLRGLDLPEGWAEIAHRDGRVTTVIGACTVHWNEIAVPDDVVEEIIDHGHGFDGDVRCRCATLAVGRLAALAEDRGCVVGVVGIVSDTEC